MTVERGQPAQRGPRRVRPAVIGAGLWLWLTAAAGVAQALPGGLPANAELYVRARPFTLSRATLNTGLRNPLVRRVLAYVEHTTGLRPERDLTWLEGTVVLGVLRAGPESPVARLYGQSQRRARYDAIVSELRNLAVALDTYQLDKSRLPARLDELIPDYLDHLPQLEGASIDYSLQMGVYTLTSRFAPGADLELEGKPPLYKQQDGLVAERLPVEQQGGLVVALGCRDRLQATRFLRRLESSYPELLKSQGAGWALATPAGQGTLTLDDGWLLYSDDPALVVPCLEALNGRGLGLESNPRIQVQARQLPPFDQLCGFVDVQDILEHAPQLGESTRHLLGPLKSLGVSSQWASPHEVRTELFAQIEATPGDVWERLLLAPPDGDLPFLSRVPWDIAGFVALDGGQLFGLLDRACQADPAFGVRYTEAIGKAERALGFPLTRQLLTQETGELLITTEYSDLVAALLDLAARSPKLGSLAESGAQPSPTPQAPSVAHLPFTVSLEILEAGEREAIYNHLRTWLGSPSREYAQSRVRVETSPDGSLALAHPQNLLLLAGGGSSRLLDHILETMDGGRACLSRLDSCQRFVGSLKGRPLVFTHTKVDWLYSLGKGLLLLLGSDFRQQATALGQWRDTYTAFSVEPGGLRLAASVFATDQVPGR